MQERNKEILILYSTGNYSLADIAIRYGIHRERVYQIVHRDRFSGKTRRRSRTGRGRPKGYLKLFKDNPNLCVKCGSYDKLTADHIIPLSKGGKSEYSNLQIMCLSCNMKKGARI